MPNDCTHRRRANSGTGDADIFIPVTNGIESLNARFRQAVRRRGHFPTEQAAMKILYLTVRERRPNRSNPTGRINGWKAILNTLAITYGDRLNIN
jgi:putative transposase